MPIGLVYEDRPEYLLVRVLGEWTFPRLLEAIDAASVAMDTRGRTRLLIDARSLGSPLLLIDHYDAAKELADRCCGRRIAVVTRHGQLNQLGLDVARDRGLDIVVETDTDAATDWLLLDER